MPSLNKNMIVIVDDEPDIVELVKINLEKAGYKVKGFSNARELSDFIKKYVPDLIILDIMLPDSDGLEICKNLKQEKRTRHVPVIMLTAKSDEMDKILGLEFGADDYITKPFSPRELAARVKAVLRRNTDRDKSSDIIDIANVIQIDPRQYRVIIKDKEIQLTTTEFKILLTLAEHKGWVLSRDQLLDQLWGDDKIVVDRTIDVHIRHLREKLGKYGEYIKNIRGVGYKLEE